MVWFQTEKQINILIEEKASLFQYGLISNIRDEYYSIRGIESLYSNMVWFQTLNKYILYVRSIKVSIPIWSDFKPGSTPECNNHICLYSNMVWFQTMIWMQKKKKSHLVSIPIWSDFKPAAEPSAQSSAKCLYSNMVWFQTKTSRVWILPSMKSLFQYGLISNKNMGTITNTHKHYISIPIWSDFKRTKTTRIPRTNQRVSIPIWSDFKRCGICTHLKKKDYSLYSNMVWFQTLLLQTGISHSFKSLFQYGLISNIDICNCLYLMRPVSIPIWSDFKRVITKNTY